MIITYHLILWIVSLHIAIKFARACRLFISLKNYIQISPFFYRKTSALKVLQDKYIYICIYLYIYVCMYIYVYLKL